MKKYALILILLCFALTRSFSQGISVVVNYTTSPTLSDKALIFYDSNRKLTWNDFKATPNDASPGAAITSAGFGYNSSFASDAEKTTLTITVYCDFNKNESWVKPVGRNDYILNHEQHHFDISYICTLLFIKKLRASKFTVSNYSQLIKNTYKATAQQMNDMQNQYDIETHNGLIKDKQQQWMDKIDKQLQTLKAAEQ